jgi:3-oxoacyl-[acyl-carrier protein] reductase
MNPADGDLAKTALGFSALGRYGKTADIGAAVTFLASPAARYITGSVLTVDGGFNA